MPTTEQPWYSTRDRGMKNRPVLNQISPPKNLGDPSRGTVATPEMLDTIVTAIIKEHAEKRETIRQVQVYGEGLEICERYRIPETLRAAFAPSLSAPEVFRLAMAVTQARPDTSRFEAILCDESPFKGDADGELWYADAGEFKVREGCPVLWRHDGLVPCGRVESWWHDAARHQIRGIIDLSTPIGMQCSFTSRNAWWEAIRGEVGLSPYLKGNFLCNKLFTSGEITEVSLTATPRNKRLGIVRHV